MKKVLLVVLSFICLLASFLTIHLYSEVTTGFMLPTNQAKIYLDGDKSSIKEEKDLLKQIEEISKKHNLVITRIDLNESSSGSYSRGFENYTLYTTATKAEDRVYKNMSLTSGRYLNESDSEQAFVSSVQTEDPNQVGCINRFNVSTKINIKPFSAQHNLPMSSLYYIGSNNQELIDSMILDLKNISTEDTKVIKYEETDFNGNKVSNLGLFKILIGTVLFFCIYILAIITFVYYIISRYKEFAILKMFGYSNKSVINKIIFKDIAKLFGIAQGINIVITLIMLGIYNGFADFLNFSVLWLAIQIGILLLSLVVFAIVSQSVRKIKTSQMLKNKKPTKTVHISNLITKILFSCIIVSIIFMSFQNISNIMTQNKDLERWEQIRNYAYTKFKDASFNNMKSEDEVRQQYETSNRVKDFFVRTNNNDGILISISIYFTDPTFKEQDYYKKNPEYEPGGKTVTINNNYLKLNPVYDTNRNRVNVSDENSDVMTLLVPEKYKQHEQDLLDRYQKHRLSSFSWCIDRYLFGMGEDVGYDRNLNYFERLPFLEKKYGTPQFNIIYVKDNQDYFSYKPDICKETGNKVTDPVAIVHNNKTMLGNEIESMISRGEYFVKTTDIENPNAGIMEDLKATGTEGNIRVHSLYKYVEVYISDVYQQLAVQVFAIVISLAILIAILMISTSNYIEAKSQLNAVEKIHGYSFLSRHWQHLLLVPLFWTLMFGGMSFVAITTNLTQFISIGAIGLGSLAMMILEFIISIPIIKIKERKKTKDVLKGE